MQNFDYQRRTFVMFGRGRENEAGSILKYEGARRIMIHYDDASHKPDLFDRIKRSLDRAGLEFFVFGKTQEIAWADTVYEGINYCRQEHIDAVLAVGGASAINSAKAISAGALYAGDFWDFFSGVREPVRTLINGAITTSSDTGAECSAVCTIAREIDGKLRKFNKSSPAFLPRFAIINPELSLSIDNKSTAVAAMDMIAHVIECYFTNTPNVNLTDELCEGILRTIINTLPRTIEDPNDYDARANLMLAGTLAQNGMCGLGREADWSVHVLELELAATYRTLRGEGLAVLIPAWMTYCLKHNPMRMAQFANKVFGIALNYDDPTDTAFKGIEALRVFFHRCGLPQNFFEMGLPMVDVVKLVESLHLKDGATIGNYVKLDSTACESIYTLAYTYRQTRRLLPHYNVQLITQQLPKMMGTDDYLSYSKKAAAAAFCVLGWFVWPIQQARARLNAAS